MNVTKETRDLLAPHGDIWCMNEAILPRYIGPAAGDIASRNRLPRANGTVAIIPVYGVLTKRGVYGYGGTDMLGRTLDAAMRHRDISAVVLDVDSPGGSTYGLPEFADKIYSYRNADKPLVTVYNPVGASAALWGPSGSRHSVASPSSDIGSVGVWTMHVDYSGALEDAKIKVTYIFAGKHKVDGNPHQPLTDDVKADIQKGVDETYDQFVAAMARNRGVSKSEVKAKFGDGKMLSANDAKSVGLVDRVATLDDVLAGMKAQGVVDGEHLESVITEHLCDVWHDKPVVEEPKGHGVEALRRKRERERSRA